MFSGVGGGGGDGDESISAILFGNSKIKLFSFD